MSEEIKTIEVVDIQFRPGQKVYYFDPAGHTYQAGDHVIIDTARGDEYGYCTGGNHRLPCVAICLFSAIALAEWHSWILLTLRRPTYKME